MTHMTPRIEIDHLTKSYGDKVAVHDLNLTLSSGEVFCFLGPNGAGKTTTIHTIVGHKNPTTGDVRINGVASAIGGALIWTFAASALGFLLPDLQRRATFLSGTPAVAKYLYVGTCAVLLGLVGVAHVQYGLARMDGGSYAGLITFVVITLVAAFSAVTWWALHRFPRIEL